LVQEDLINGVRVTQKTKVCVYWLPFLLFVFYFNFRRDISGALGYEHFAAISMESKMAGNVQTVLSMIDV